MLTLLDSPVKPANDRNSLLPWHNIQWQRITQALHSENLPHALLLTGPAGVGKSQFAFTLAQKLFCQSELEIACGQCKGCLLNKAHTHPDLLAIKAETNSQVIRIEQIRNLILWIAETAQQQGYKIVIIEAAEKMNLAAANALLKSLEEPPERTLFILTTAYPQRLLATVRSRCQKLTFPIPAKSEALNWLRQQLAITAEEAQELLALTQGAPVGLDLVSYREQLVLKKQFIQDISHLSLKKSLPVAAAEPWVKADVGLCLQWWTFWIDDLLTKTIAGVKQSVQDSALTVDALFSFRAYLVEIRRNLALQPGMNKQLLLEHLFIHWSELVSFTKQSYT